MWKLSESLLSECDIILHCTFSKFSPPTSTQWLPSLASNRAVLLLTSDQLTTKNSGHFLTLHLSVEFDIVDDLLILKILCSLAFGDTMYSLFFPLSLFISFEVFLPLHNPSKLVFFDVPSPLIDGLSLHGLSEIAHLTLGLQPPSVR